MPIDSENLALKGLDDLFSTEENRQEEQREQVQQIPIDALHPFTNHPFKVLDDEAMTRTVESIAQYGVLAPLIARPRPDGDGYEIISGHRRQYAAKLAGLENLPVIVRQMDDDEQGVVGRNSKNIPNTSIVRMIKNKCYTGYLINGAVEAECPQLRIIEPELFEQAQELRQARTCERGSTPLGTSSKALLTGLVYCGHCGNRLSLTSSGRTHTYADGHTVKEVRPRYSCFYKIRHPGDCDGQSGYGVSKLDSIVEEVVRQIFVQFREVSRKKLLESVKTNDAARIQKKIKKIQKDLEAKQKELDDLKAETILVIRGVSALDKELLGTLVAEARDALETLEKQLVQAQEEYDEATKTAKRSNYICNELFTWADVYDTANHDERRAILQQFIKEIRVRKDYEISITLNASFEQVEQLKAVSTYDGAEIFEEISEKGA